MAMACFVDRAPCLPARIWSTSSLTNSPAWVLGAFSSRLSAFARFSVVFEGLAPDPPCRVRLRRTQSLAIKMPIKPVE